MFSVVKCMPLLSLEYPEIVDVVGQDNISVNKQASKQREQKTTGPKDTKKHYISP